MPRLSLPDLWPAVSGSVVRRAGTIAAAGCAVALAVYGGGAGIDEQLRLIRDRVHPIEATGRLTVVEMDSRSQRRIGQYPWPRRYHAALVDRLHAAGAAAIAFDVDFSDRSTAGDDRTFARALERAGGGVILPTFKQALSSTSREFGENVAIDALRKNAFLASVNVQPDLDGQLRRSSYGTVTQGVPRPSVGAVLAGVAGNIGRDFRVDTAIDPATIPRLSAIDVIDGRIPAAALRGRSLLIGATAIEMGDRYAVPGHGVLPGVVVQALAAETLMQRRALAEWGAWLPLLLAAGLFAGAMRIRQALQSGVMSLAAIVILALPLALELTSIASVEVIPALAFLLINAAWLGVARTKQTLSESRLTDATTGLPNGRALARAGATGNATAFTVMRLKQFDEMNAVLSDDDRASLLAQVLARLDLGFGGAAVHALEPGVLAWAGSDVDIDIATDRIESAAALFRAPVRLGNRSLLVTPAFGYAQTTSAIDAARTLAQASLAARHAQEAGQRWSIHSDSAATATDRSLMLVADIEGAIARGDVHVLYQPKYMFDRNRIAGVEALVRWRHPELGPVGPDEFIPLLETAGLMRALTLAIVATCFAQLEAWHRDCHALGIAINISATLLEDDEFVAALQERLTQSPLTGHVTLEVTESATITGASSAIAALTAFRAAGARISIDDYGTGHATLTYLRSFPADEIKIDKSFVTDMLASPSDQILVRSTIELAHQLGFKVVAEGVENDACLARLRSYACDVAQGWVIGRPMPAADVIALLNAPAVRLAA